MSIIELPGVAIPLIVIKIASRTTKDRSLPRENKAPDPIPFFIDGYSADAATGTRIGTQFAMQVRLAPKPITSPAEIAAIIQAS
jgi:uncharacterized alpha/beta hydrolase family protein